jgi:hypothetical protein
MTARAAITGMVLLAGAAACHDAAQAPAAGPAPGTLPFKALQAAVVSPDEGETPESCPLEGALLLAFAAGPVDPGPDRPNLKVALGCVALDPDGVGIHAGVEMEGAQADAPEQLVEGHAARECAGCGRGRRPNALLWTTARAVRAALDQAAAEFRLAGAKDAEILAFLEHPDAVATDVLLTAIDEAGNRRLLPALPKVLALLEARDPEVVLRAAGALARLGDPSAIRPLARLAYSTAPEVPHVALRAIADIGGAEARRTLDLLAGQVPDPIVAAEARGMVEELDGPVGD